MKQRWYIAGGGLLALAAWLLLALLWPAPGRPAAEEAVQAALSTKVQAPQREVLPVQAEEPEPYVSPVDFESLWAVNEDIYAWLYIPGTEVSYPLLQREGDDGYYLSRNSQGETDKNGSLFTESAYNSKDFSDPVTVVYGHHMRSGAMFGNLQADYASGDFSGERGEVMVYLPKEEICYRVFAGVPYSGTHILYYYDFSIPVVYEAFLDQIFSTRGLNANIREDAEVTPEDQLLILSTCLQGNNKRRYLVLAQRVDDRDTAQITESPRKEASS
nr:class B sortase [uncultured Oscillibacter sp.]